MTKFAIDLHFITTYKILRLTHWCRVTHICVVKLTIIGSNNGVSLGRRQTIIWTNAGILLIGPWGTDFSEILIEIQICLLTKMRAKMSSVQFCPFHFALNVLRDLEWWSMEINIDFILWCYALSRAKHKTNNTITKWNKDDTEISYPQ